MPGKYLTEGHMDEIVDAVVKALDKREADKKAEAEAAKAFVQQAEKEARLQMWRDKQRRLEEKQAECQHNRKYTHKFSDGIQVWIRCQDCDKVWKTVAEPEPKKLTPIWAKPFTKKCDHYTNGLDRKSTIHEIWRGVTRCSLCMEQWGKAVI